MATRAYCGAHFLVVNEGVLIITSTGTHIEEPKDFMDNADKLLLAALEQKNFFIEPEEALSLGVST